MQITSAALLPLILGLVQVGLQIGMPKKFSPILAIVLGVLAGIFYLAPGNYAMAVLVGVSLGLGAVGLHSGVKNVKEGIVTIAQNASAKKAIKAAQMQANQAAPAQSGEVKTATAANPENPTTAAQAQTQQAAQQGAQPNANA